MRNAITATVRWAAATQTITLSAAITAKACESAVPSTVWQQRPEGTVHLWHHRRCWCVTFRRSDSDHRRHGDRRRRSRARPAAAFESTTIPGLDSDTLNGSWVGFSAGLATSGNATTAVALRPQYKIVTAAGAQTFNLRVTPIGGYASLVWSPRCSPASPQHGRRPGVSGRMSRHPRRDVGHQVRCHSITCDDVERRCGSAGTSISENFNTGTVAADANFTNVLGTVVISGGKLNLLGQHQTLGGDILSPAQHAPQQRGSLRRSDLDLR